MVIAALVVFGALLAACLVAPAERTWVSRSAGSHHGEIGAPLTEGLAEAA